MMHHHSHRLLGFAPLSIMLAIFTLFGVFITLAAATTVVEAERQAADASLAGPSATPTASCMRTWDVIPSPNDTNYDNTLRSASAISPDDIWAVGDRQTNMLNEHRTITMHWDGQVWTIVPGLSPGVDNYLSAVAAVSANDVWAAGGYYDGSITQAMLLHWNGTQWSQIAIPNLGSASSSLGGLASIGTNDVWAVGSYGFFSSNTRVLALHWDGTQWTQVPVTSPVGSSLRGISALAANDIWAVGGNASSGSLAYHWNGTQWNQVPTPQGIYPEAVKAISTNDVWAVGYYYEADTSRTRTMHWDGIQWTIISSPNVNMEHNLLRGVAALSSSDVWAVGYYAEGGIARTLTLHYDGTQWSIVASPSPSSGPALLNGVAADPTGAVWAVGSYSPFNGRTLVLRYPGGCLTPTPTAATPIPTESATTTITPTFTPIPPSSTPVLAPGTATGVSTVTASVTAIATPTECSLSFIDVPTTSTFYANIRCLACRGILGGYSDGTFRPNNDITREQIAKVVSNAAGFNEDPGPQIYEDVSPSNTFYAWINRLSMRGHMGGYPCGIVPSEPCGTPNRPYFRPDASATRGQLAKIVASAASLTGTPTGQRYADVPEDSTFYVWVEQLSNLGVMGGYACGSAPIEPCDDQNRSYFRPLNNVTRGQASKIAANTFLPNCQTP